LAWWIVLVATRISASLSLASTGWRCWCCGRGAGNCCWSRRFRCERIKSTLARLGIRNFKPTLRKAAERLATVHTPEGVPLPPNTLAELQRDMARLGFVVSDLSRSLVALDQNSSIAVIEISQSSWLVAGMLPGIERQRARSSIRAQNGCLPAASLAG
jgi:hypothetical protein